MRVRRFLFVMAMVASSALLASCSGSSAGGDAASSNSAPNEISTTTAAPATTAQPTTTTTAVRQTSITQEYQYGSNVVTSMVGSFKHGRKLPQEVYSAVVGRDGVDFDPAAPGTEYVWGKLRLENTSEYTIQPALDRYLIVAPHSQFPLCDRPSQDKSGLLKPDDGWCSYYGPATKYVFNTEFLSLAPGESVDLDFIATDLMLSPASGIPAEVAQSKAMVIGLNDPDTSSVVDGPKTQIVQTATPKNSTLT